MNNKVESDITTIMVFLKTISQIKVGQKYNLYDGKFVSSSSIDGAIRRYWNGENRHTLVDELERTYANAWKIINEGGIGKKYTDLNYNYYNTTLDVSAISLHKLLQTAMKLDAINEWGSVVALTYIAAQRIFPDYGDMADAKSLLESIARGMGYHYGVKKKVRVNTVSQSPTMTTAGSGVGGFDAFMNYAEDMSPLGNAPALDCANYCITLFSDLTKYVTMQNLFHDGGFSKTGVSEKVMDKFRNE